MKKVISVLCVLMIMLMVCPAFAAADALEEKMLGTVSEQYESSGDPGSISGGNGDLGGASYGAYQFASRYDVPLTFARWCVSSGSNKEYGSALINAYSADGNTFGESFNGVWKELAQTDKEGFLLLQRQYVRHQYYDPAVKALLSNFNLKIERYGIAFKNAVWSRTLQHGLGSYDNETGFMGIMKQVDRQSEKGLLALTEEQLITAVYEESGKVTASGTNAMKASNAGGNAWIIRQYELEGKYMKYFSGNSAAVQAGVYLRLRVNELTDLLEMLAQYGGFEGAEDDSIIYPVLEQQTLLLSDCNTLKGWTAGQSASIGLMEKEEDDSALMLLPLTASDAEETARLTFGVGVNFSGFTHIVFDFYIPQVLPAGALRLRLYALGTDTPVYDEALSLTGYEIGWSELAYDLPSNEPLGGVVAVALTFDDLPEDMVSSRFMADDLRGIAGEGALQSAMVNADALNCRTGPSTEYGALGQFLGGTTVAVVGDGIDGWYFCTGQSTKGETLLGWCSGDYLIFGEIDYLPGDVNDDKELNAVDALLILQFAVNKAELTPLQQTVADINRDDAINALDALSVLKRAVAG